MAKASVTETRRVRYEEDLYAWSYEQASLLRARQSDGLDWDNLAEEIESMVGRDRRELEESPPHHSSASPEVAGDNPASVVPAGARACAPSAAISGICFSRARVCGGWCRNSCEKRIPDAVKDAVDETGLPADRFPAGLPLYVR